MCIDDFKRREILDNFKNLSKYLNEKDAIDSINTFSDSIIISLYNENNKKLIVASSQTDGRDLTQHLKYLCPDKKIVFLPEWEILPYDIISPSRSITAERINAINDIYNNGYDIIITTPNSILKKIPDKDIFNQFIIKINILQEIDREEFIEKLLKLSYERVTYIEQQGDVAVRGMVIDIFPAGTSKPLRIVFDGDMVEEIYYIDIKSQLKKGLYERDEILILPLFETFVSAEILSEISKETGKNEGLEWFASKYFNTVNLIDILDKEKIIIMEEVLYQIEKSYEDIFRMYKSRTDNPDKPERVYDLKIKKKLEKRKYLKIKQGKGFFNENIQYNKNRISFFEDIEYILENKGKVIVSAGKEGYLNRIKEIIDPGTKYKSKIKFLLAPVKRGFKNIYDNIIWITQDDFFGINSISDNLQFDRAEPFEYSEDLDFKENDYVVHLNYGIGIYKGIELVNVLGKEREYAKIEYAEGDILYVPMYQFHLLHKYRSIDDKKPELCRLHGKDWSNKRTRAEKSAKETAKNLIRLYALRGSVKGIKLSKDTEWQIEFEGGFNFIETEDQHQAIEDVKKDMESLKPMDRLICGDSGYGKTEVALRASFKASSNNYQTAFICPTTLLAQQHFFTFTERFKSFPFRVELLSRFQTHSEQKKIIEDTKNGDVDILIGTHRLLGKDMGFQNLGLIIIDEEQRFGVKQKEKLKMIRKSADILTMTATPIPRTLQMALSSIKDLSVIMTPPGGREPVNITVARYNTRLVEEFIRREISRKGQVFYIHNRVKTIYSVADKLQKLFPDVKLVVAHGQMEEKELEQHFEDFYYRKYDILVCTTIVENGIDVSNANTIIIDNSERFGLAQLYQLKGRVGRSPRRAYAYLSYRKEGLTADAKKRLKAIKEFNKSGSGYMIAVRDLEIRGSGELLGKKQSGQVADVGFDIYSSLVARAVKLLKGEEIIEERVATVDIDVEFGIPEDFIPDQKIRLQLYRKLSAIKDSRELPILLKNLSDRFGNLPEKLINLFKIIEIKIKCEENGIVYLMQKNNKLIINFEPDKNNEYISYKNKLKKYIISSDDERKRMTLNNLIDNISESNTIFEQLYCII